MDAAGLARPNPAGSAVLQADKLEAVADRGYFDGEEILACEEASIAVTLPKPMTSGAKAKGPVALNGANCKVIWQSEWKPRHHEDFVTQRGAAMKDGKVVRGTADGLFATSKLQLFAQRGLKRSLVRRVRCRSD